MPTHYVFTVNVRYGTVEGFYALVQRRSDKQTWNGSDLEPYDVGNWLSYAVPLENEGGASGNLWSVALPYSMLPHDDYVVIVKQKATATPSPTDRTVDSQIVPRWGTPKTPTVSYASSGN